MLIATIDGNGLATSTHYIHTDHLTGSNVITNSSGAQEQVLVYCPFGDTYVNSRSGSFDEQRKFTGHEHDGQTDLTYMGTRYYPGDFKLKWAQFASSASPTTVMKGSYLRAEPVE